MRILGLGCHCFFMTLAMSTAAMSSAIADEAAFSTLYAFEAPDATTLASPFGSQPNTLPVVGPEDSILGMTSEGGNNGTGVIYRFNLDSHRYTVLHTFSALANGTNEDGAVPGLALTRGPDEVFYGVAQFGGENGSGTIFSITASGDFTVLHTFSAVDTNLHNEDGANPLRTVVVGKDGRLYGTTRLGGLNTCGITRGCGVAWVMDRSGEHFSVLHQFTADEGHVAALMQARDGFFYGCGVYPFTSLHGTPLPSGTLYRMAPSGQFETLYTFTQTNTSGSNSDGADCFESLVETESGVFYGATYYGGTNGTGVVFRYSLSKPGMVEVLHDFSAVNAAGENSDGANPEGRLTLGEDSTLYSTAQVGGANGNGVVYRIRPDGDFKVLHTFSAGDPKTGGSIDGAVPNLGVILHDGSLIGIAIYGGNGSSAGPNFSGGTLYQLRLDE